MSPVPSPPPVQLPLCRWVVFVAISRKSWIASQFGQSSVWGRHVFTSSLCLSIHSAICCPILTSTISQEHLEEGSFFPVYDCFSDHRMASIWQARGHKLLCKSRISVSIGQPIILLIWTPAGTADYYLGKHQFLKLRRTKLKQKSINKDNKHNNNYYYSSSSMGLPVWYMVSLATLIFWEFTVSGSGAVRVGFDPRYLPADLFPFSGADTAAPHLPPRLRLPAETTTRLRRRPSDRLLAAPREPTVATAALSKRGDVNSRYLGTEHRSQKCFIPL